MQHPPIFPLSRTRASLSAAGPFYSLHQCHHEVSFHLVHDETTGPNNHGCIIIKTSTYPPGLSIPSYPSHIVVQLQQSFLYCSRHAAFTPIQPSKPRPTPHMPTSASGTSTLLLMRCSSVLTACQNHLSTLWSTLLDDSFSIPAILCTAPLHF